MASGISEITAGAQGSQRRIERAIVMHGTTRVRQEGVRILARIASATGAKGVAYGWTDGLAPRRLVPVHAVTRAPGVRWEVDLPGTSAPMLDREGSLTWRLMIRDADEAGLRRAAPEIATALGWYADSGLRDCPRLHADAASGPCGRFLGLLDGYRLIGFDAGEIESSSIREELRDAARRVPEPALASALEVVDAFDDRGHLSSALLRLGSALDASGALAEAVSAHTIGYELALSRCDAGAGIDAARMAGRAHRRLTEWSEAFRWYALARRIAELEGDDRGLTLAIDGEGHTHRAQGDFPAARACYVEAWARSLDSGDPALVAAIGHSMMTVEREAGRLAEAARYGWMALQRQDEPEQRSNLLLNIGTLLRDAGDVPCAVDAYALARRTATARETRMMAADALAYCAALRADPGYAYWRRVASLESRGAPTYLRAQIGYFRGASLQALGDHRRARRVLGAVERYATRAGLHEWQMKAAGLAERPLPQPEPAAAPVELQQGLRELLEASV